MTLIRRRKSPNPAQKGINIVRLALRGLVVQRIARNALRLYKLGRRLPLLIGGAVVAIFALKKLRGSGDQGGPETWTAPPSTPAPAPIKTAPEPAESPVETAATGTPPVEESGPEVAGAPEVPESEGDGAPDPDIEIAAAATDAGTTDGGSDAVADDAAADDAATTIGDDLAAAAEGASKNGEGEKS